ncbi:MAG: hypothetical protein M3Q91_02715 [Acidobacteriota bacterium]|nr:hypothetical protein [Acidobacteriota bacterium]
MLTDSDLNKGRALVAAFMFGALVGLAEIASRYRDEPLKAVGSPYGLVYLFLNGYLSMLPFFSFCCWLLYWLFKTSTMHRRRRSVILTTITRRRQLCRMPSSNWPLVSFS